MAMRNAFDGDEAAGNQFEVGRRAFKDFRSVILDLALHFGGGAYDRGSGHIRHAARRVPQLYGEPSVSGLAMLTRSSGMCNASAQIWLRTVLEPWPISTEPVLSRTVPSSSRRMMAPVDSSPLI